MVANVETEVSITKLNTSQESCLDNKIKLNIDCKEKEKKYNPTEKLPIDLEKEISKIKISNTQSFINQNSSLAQNSVSTINNIISSPSRLTRYQTGQLGFHLVAHSQMNSTKKRIETAIPPSEKNRLQELTTFPSQSLSLTIYLNQADFIMPIPHLSAWVQNYNNYFYLPFPYLIYNHTYLIYQSRLKILLIISLKISANNLYINFTFTFLQYNNITDTPTLPLVINEPLDFNQVNPNLLQLISYMLPQNLVVSNNTIHYSNFALDRLPRRHIARYKET